MVALDPPDLALLADETNMPHLLIAQELERGLHHADPRAQYRDETHLVLETRSLIRRERGLDFALVGREIRGGFIKKEGRDLCDELAEDLRWRRLVAKSRELLPHEGMARDVELFDAQLARPAQSPGAGEVTYAFTLSGVMPGTGK